MVLGDFLEEYSFGIGLFLFQILSLNSRPIVVDIYFHIFHMLVKFFVSHLGFKSMVWIMAYFIYISWLLGRNVKWISGMKATFICVFCLPVLPVITIFNLTICIPDICLLLSLMLSPLYMIIVYHNRLEYCVTHIILEIVLIHWYVDVYTWRYTKRVLV